MRVRITDINPNSNERDQAAGFLNFVHIDGKENPADVATKFTSVSDWCHLMN